MNEKRNQPHWACPREMRWLLLFANWHFNKIVYMPHSCWFEISSCIICAMHMPFTVTFSCIYEINNSRTIKNSPMVKTHVTVPGKYIRFWTIKHFVFNLFCSYAVLFLKKFVIFCMAIDFNIVILTKIWLQK